MEVDGNNDGKPDNITFIATMQGRAPVTSVKALIEFTYFFDSYLLRAGDIKVGVEFQPG